MRCRIKNVGSARPIFSCGEGRGGEVLGRLGLGDLKVYLRQEQGTKVIDRRALRAEAC
jgi:hypothetical protein